MPFSRSINEVGIAAPPFSSQDETVDFPADLLELRHLLHLRTEMQIPGGTK